MIAADQLKKSFSDEAATAVSQAETLLLENNLEEALALLFSLEKKCRLGNDHTTLKMVCLRMVQLCKEKSDWNRLNSTLAVINKRRAQHKWAISAIVEESMTYLADLEDVEVKINLIKTLSDICEGKMYVEAESARLHLMNAKILEEKGDIGGACDSIQDVHVETYGSLGKKEKAEYIIEQIRLNLLRKDFIRTLIQSRKMNRKMIEEPEMQAVKIKYYLLLVEYYMTSVVAPADVNESSGLSGGDEDTSDIDVVCWEICQCYYKIYDTESIRQDPVRLKHYLLSTILFLVLSKYSNHQQDMINRFHAIQQAEQDIRSNISNKTSGVTLLSALLASGDKDASTSSGDIESTSATAWSEISPYLTLLTSLSCPPSSDNAGVAPTPGVRLPELISYPFPELAMLQKHCEITIRTSLTPDDTSSVGAPDQVALDAVIASKAKLFCETLRSRVVEHNIRVVAKYYTQIRLPRLAQLLALEVTEVEERLSKMVSLEDIVVRIDRPAGLVVFVKGSNAGTTGEMNDILTCWSSNISTMLTLVETTCHLIHRETMVHKA